MKRETQNHRPSAQSDLDSAQRRHEQVLKHKSNTTQGDRKLANTHSNLKASHSLAGKFQICFGSKPMGLPFTTHTETKTNLVHFQIDRTAPINTSKQDMQTPEEQRCEE